MSSSIFQLRAPAGSTAATVASDTIPIQRAILSLRNSPNAIPRIYPETIAAAKRPPVSTAADREAWFSSFAAPCRARVSEGTFPAGVFGADQEIENLPDRGDPFIGRARVGSVELDADRGTSLEITGQR